ncbi:MAG TPA: dynamin family protein [Nocardia sp.]|uniref:dynamin family protein n=1 Tax=Nocardia sp. TaxID=1821 RepID=UPI002B4AFA03|nr:dynamin family protein [Nocardia sp.]HLS76055.1 dynamin family protein [Nocardia sp.]
MTTADPAIEARRLLAEARRRLADRPRERAQLDECARRLDEPLRVALAGSIKAGKSTLLNALVGQDIAPTDATECTRLVTWYRHGGAPGVDAVAVDGAVAPVPVRRGGGAHGLTFDLSAPAWNRPGPHEVDHLEVRWPAATLAGLTLVDTPGTSSLSREVSRRTARLLAPEADERDPVPVPGADAVVYLLRRLDAADMDLLERLGGGDGPLGVIGVVSRADELGAGGLDALHSARTVAARFADDLDRTGLCQAVVPVAGLLAFAAATLREPEFRAFQALARVPVADLGAALLSADRFARPDIRLPVDPGVRMALAARFGMFGIRMAVTLIRLGVADSATLAAELAERSGIQELRAVLDSRFAQRAGQLGAHSALAGLAGVLAACPGTAADALLPRVRTLLADVHGFAELRLLSRLRAGALPLPAAELAELHRLLGGAGVAPHLRLGLPADARPALVRARAIELVRAWRDRAAHPLADGRTRAACLTAARSAEGVLPLLPPPR